MSLSSRDHSRSKHRARRAPALLGAALAALLLVATQAFAFDEVDDIVPDAKDMATERVESLMSTEAAPCPDCGELVNYLSFFSVTHQLTRYTGAYVQLLLPDSWIGVGGLTDSERRLLIDRSDFFYAHAMELVGGEPGGTGKLTIAVVPNACPQGALGCARQGSRGIQLADSSLALLRKDLPSGVLPYIVGHELSHNFDLRAFDLFTYPTGPDEHAWTNFAHFYLAAYSGMGSRDRSPIQLLEDQLEDGFQRYLEDPDASWQTCVVEAGCPVHEPNEVWAGVAHRFAQLHGSSAVKVYLAEVANLGAGIPRPTTLQEVADIQMQAMGRAVQRDLTCYADAWRWPLSQAVHDDLARFGPPAACADGDGDGTSAVLGDCDDANPARSPGFAEVAANGIDEDCDGLVDEGATIVEPASGFPWDYPIPYPARVEGTLTSSGEGIPYFTLAAPEAVEFEFCSDEVSGKLEVWDQSYRTVGRQDTSQGGCSRRSYVLGAGTWRVRLSKSATSGDGTYAIEIRPGTAWPTASWGGLTVNPTATACRYNAVTSTTALPSGIPWPNRARLWATGLGFVGSAAYRGEASIPWIPPQGEGNYALRAQLQSGSTPVSDWGTATSFDFVPPAGGCGPCDDGIDNDGDGLIDAGADPGCKDITSKSEAPACDDGIDNDADGTIDWDGGPTGGPADTHCGGLGYNGAEKPTPRCGIIGIEPALLLPLRGALRRMRRAREARRAHSSTETE